MSPIVSYKKYIAKLKKMTIADKTELLETLTTDDGEWAQETYAVLIEDAFSENDAETILYWDDELGQANFFTDFRNETINDLTRKSASRRRSRTKSHNRTKSRSRTKSHRRTK